jgi:uncharacterized protein
VRDTILWRRLDLPGHEIGRLKSLDDGRELSGTAVFSHEQRPCKLDYLVITDSGWRTKSSQIGGMIGDREIDIRVSVNNDRKWFLNDVECAAVAGCVDIDLGFSPITNLLPIRRLSLDVGQEAEVKAAWLPFPSLEFELLRQTYRREGETTYRYESGGGVFMRMLEVNEVGFVTNYPGLWVEEVTGA